jgi:hypothetical protein
MAKLYGVLKNPIEVEHIMKPASSETLQWHIVYAHQDRPEAGVAYIAVRNADGSFRRNGTMHYRGGSRQESIAEFSKNGNYVAV